jgi:2-dehydro-3-deoxyphosphogluconate aldolase / (4S)-4-hydroxy-2-oxoglutarate aldolase
VSAGRPPAAVTGPLPTITGDRVVSVVRADRTFDIGSLVAALTDGGIRAVEQADDAVDAGARFLVTPSVSEGVAHAAAAHDVPVITGALSPTEVRAALDLGAAAYLRAGAVAVTAGTDVVAPDLVAGSQWAAITERAATFVAAIADGDWS